MSRSRFNTHQGVCPVCGRVTVLRKKDGAVGVHGDGNWPPGNCPGWGQQPTKALTRLDEDIISQAIKAFPFWDYGLDDVDPDSEYAEWVPQLAAKIAEALKHGAS